MSVPAVRSRSILSPVRISQIVEDIVQAYRSDSRPWVVGFSGGKDSTALLQLTYRALKEIPEAHLSKHVYVVCTDTRIEPPNIIQHIDEMLDRVAKAAVRDTLPLTVHKLTPKLQDRYFVKLIGRGYPAPNRFFRWCTDRLKIRPCNSFIKERIAESGEVIVVLGVRHAEGATRSGSITRHGINGSRFSHHAALPNAWIYAPIKHLETDALWLYLTLSEPPWGGDNEKLAQLYKRANGECPLVIDKSTPTCGGSRFGCWTCTVVKSDKSMQGFVERGDDWMKPLLEFRDWLKVMRNEARHRKKTRRNGFNFYRDPQMGYLFLKDYLSGRGEQPPRYVEAWDGTMNDPSWPNIFRTQCAHVWAHALNQQHFEVSDNDRCELYSRGRQYQGINAAVQYAQAHVAGGEESSEEEAGQSKRKDIAHRYSYILAPLRRYHTGEDYNFIDRIIEAFNAGRTVILDLGSVDIQTALFLSGLVASRLWADRNRRFTSVEATLPEGLVVIEEAHNLLNNEQVKHNTIFVRVAKEGRKFNLGLIYVTQRPSSVSMEILSQTENFFVMHVSSLDDITQTYVPFNARVNRMR